MNFVIISGFSLKTPYEDEVKTLQKCLTDLKLEHKIYPFQNQKSWHKNCQQKAIIIKSALEEFKKPVVWVDADARIYSHPSFFDNLDCDFCAHFLNSRWNPNELLSGTLYFGNTTTAFKILGEWIKLNETNSTMDQKNLQEVYNGNKDGMKFVLLPTEYIKVFNFGFQQCSGPVVIEHFQASRRFKKQI